MRGAQEGSVSRAKGKLGSPHLGRVKSRDSPQMLRGQKPHMTFFRFPCKKTYTSLRDIQELLHISQRQACFQQSSLVLLFVTGPQIQPFNTPQWLAIVLGMKFKIVHVSTRPCLSRSLFGSLAPCLASLVYILATLITIWFPQMCHPLCANGPPDAASPPPVNPHPPLYHCLITPSSGKPLSLTWTLTELCLQSSYD